MRDIDFAGLMEEPPHGENHGRAASIDPHTNERHVGLSVDDAQTRELLLDGGWSIERGTAHRGVLHADEYFHEETVLLAVEQELGFTIEDVRSVYRKGRLSDTQRELRGHIDARLLALSRSGANMAALARALGFTYNARSEAYDTMQRAIARARIAEASA